MNEDIRNINIDAFNKTFSARDRILFILRFAILAPSTHNSQPWLFNVNEYSCEIFYDKNINIVEADPKQRDLFISMGCMLENLVTTAKYFGIFDRVEIAVDLEKGRIGEVFFRNNASPNESLRKLVELMKTRINVRGVFEDKQVEERVLDEVRELEPNEEVNSYLITEKSKIEQLASITREGIEIAYKSKSFRKEMSQWIHSSFSKKKSGLFGYSLGMPALLSVIFPRMVRMFNIGKKVGSLNHKTISSAPGICVITAHNENPESWLEVGQVAQRHILELLKRGVSSSIYVASIEISDLYKKVQEVLGTNETPQFVFCFGYLNSNQNYTPRFSLEERLIQL